MQRNNPSGASAALAFATALALVLGACSQVPALRMPEVPLAASYKEEAPWISARPADNLPRDAWWTLYGDGELNALQARLLANSTDLAAALARYQQAKAFTDQLRAGLYPTLSGSAEAQRMRQSVSDATPPSEFNSRAFGAQASYELDLWGRISSQLAAGSALEQAALGDLESARLSLQSELADTYIALRGLDRAIALFDDTVAAYSKALALTQTRHDGGLASGLDVASAQTQLEVARAQLAQQAAQRAVLEHAIAALAGASPSQFALEPRLAAIKLPAIPAGVPSALLQRRPDIAAAQRRIMAANTNIGVARSAYFPAVTLSAAAGYQSTASGALIATPNLFWAVGPSLVLSLFDAGRRDAQVAQAQALLDESGAKYKSLVLGAFQQVEDNLALLNHYRDAAEAERAAVTAAQRTLAFATSRYRDGAANYLEVVSAQTAALQTQRDALDLDTRQRRASVQLIRALGGGWEAADGMR